MCVFGGGVLWCVFFVCFFVVVGCFSLGGGGSFPLLIEHLKNC